MPKKLGARELFERLLAVDTEAEIIEILKEAGYWEDAAAWRFYGDQPENWATVGNQQSRAEQALIEKAMNSIDSELIAAARIKGIPLNGDKAPQSIFAARDLLFGEELKNIEQLSKSITIAATGKKTRPSISIADDGEGQTPTGMPQTILSLHKGNKNAIPFVQGKFNMGGSGVLEFCGVDHNVELVISKRNPKLLPNDASAEDRHWSYTIIRREDPSPASPRASRFTYLAPGPVDKRGNRALLSFAAPSLSIFPDKNRPYARESEWGTLFKLYEYGIRATTNMMLEGGLMGRVRILLPEPALPIRFHECRDYAGDPKRSFDTPMAGLIYTLEQDRKNPKRQNVEWFDKFEIDIDGEKFVGRIYLFRKRGKDEKKNPAENYRKDEGVVFTYNRRFSARISSAVRRSSRTTFGTRCWCLSIVAQSACEHTSGCSCQIARTCATATLSFALKRKWKRNSVITKNSNKSLWRDARGNSLKAPKYQSPSKSSSKTWSRSIHCWNRCLGQAFASRIPSNPNR